MIEDSYDNGLQSRQVLIKKKEIKTKDNFKQVVLVKN